MILYQFMDINLPDAAPAQQLPIDEPINAALGDIPGWVILNDPDYNPDVRYRNIIQEDDIVDSSYSLPTYATKNGEKVFRISDSEGIGFLPRAVPLDPDRWSGFAFVDPPEEQGEYPRGQYFGADDLVEGSDDAIALSLAHVRTPGFQRGYYIYENRVIRVSGQPVRLQWNTIDEGPGVVIWTFSVEHGLSIWFNGVRRAVNPDDKRPLEFGLEDLRTLLRARGDVGVHGLLNIDLNAPENAGHRKAIERYAMQKYGIPSP